MKELFRDRDFTRVGLFQSILEAEGIPTMIRNQHLTNSGLSDIPIPEFYPALCVVHDDDYTRAVQFIREQVILSTERANQEIQCPNCSEINPGTFDICWSCGTILEKSQNTVADATPANTPPPEATCEACGEECVLDPEDVLQHQFICPSCQHLNRIVGQ